MQWVFAMIFSTGLGVLRWWDAFIAPLAIRFRWWVLTTTRLRRVNPWVTLADEAEKLKAEMAKSADGVRAIPHRIDRCKRQMTKVMAATGASDRDIAGRLHWSMKDVRRVLEGERPRLGSPR